MVMQPRVLTDARVGGYLFLTIADALPHHLIHHPLLLDGGYTAFISFISPPTRLLMCDATVLVPTNSLPSALDDILKHPVYIVGTTRLMAATGNLSWEIVAERATFNAFEGLPFPLYKSVGQLEICLQSVDDYPFAPSAAFSQTYVVECTAISKTQYWLTRPPWDRSFEEFFSSRQGLYRWHRLLGMWHTVELPTGPCQGVEFWFRSLPEGEFTGEWTTPHLDEVAPSAPSHTPPSSPSDVWSISEWSIVLRSEPSGSQYNPTTHRLADHIDAPGSPASSMISDPIGHLSAPLDSYTALSGEIPARPGTVSPTWSPQWPSPSPPALEALSPANSSVHFEMNLGPAQPSPSPNTQVTYYELPPRTRNPPQRYSDPWKRPSHRKGYKKRA